MTKQEKIREGIRELIKPYIKDEPWKPETLFVLSYRICELLHSQGVVIKAERELHLPDLVEETHYIHGFKCSPLWGYKAKLKKAGYVAVEPLIEGK